MRQNHQIARQSMLSGKNHVRTINLDLADLERWKNGALIQEAMPYLSPSDREFLMTGVTDEEWDSAFSED